MVSKRSKLIKLNNDVNLIIEISKIPSCIITIELYNVVVNKLYNAMYFNEISRNAYDYLYKRLQQVKGA